MCVAQRRFATNQQKTCERRDTLPGFRAGEAECTVELGVVETEQGPVAAIALDGLAQPMALGGVERANIGTGDRQRGVIREPKIGLPGCELVRQKWHTLAGYRRPTAACAEGCHPRWRPADQSAGTSTRASFVPAKSTSDGPDTQRRHRAVGDHRGHTGDVPVVGVQAGRATVVLHPEIDDSPVGVRETDGCEHEVLVGQSVLVALELDCQRFGFRDLPTAHLDAYCTRTFLPAPISSRHWSLSPPSA